MFSKALVVGVVVLPVVVVVGHPIAVSFAVRDPSVAATRHGLERVIASEERAGIRYVQILAPGERLLGTSATLVDCDGMWIGNNGRYDYAESGSFEPWAAPMWVLSRSSISGDSDRVWSSVITIGYGWPSVSFASDFDELNRNLVTGIAYEAIGSGVLGIPRALPTRVVWGGLLINLALYALVVYGVCVPALVYGRRFVLRRRWSRGVCGHCRYEVGMLDRCPECGAERPVKVSAA